MRQPKPMNHAPDARRKNGSNNANRLAAATFLWRITLIHGYPEVASEPSHPRLHSPGSKCDPEARQNTRLHSTRTLRYSYKREPFIYLEESLVQVPQASLRQRPMRPAALVSMICVCPDSWSFLYPSSATMDNSTAAAEWPRDETHL